MVVKEQCFGIKLLSPTGSIEVHNLVLQDAVRTTCHYTTERGAL